MSNPLLSDFTTTYEVPPFSSIQEDHYEEAIDQALNEARSEVDNIISNDAEPSFSNVIEALENTGERLQRNTSILFNLNSAETNDQIQKLAQEISPKLSAFNSDIKQNEQLFAKVKSVFEQRLSLDLSIEEQRLLEETYLDFVRRGADLEGEKKDRFKEISIELSKLSLSFSENVLAETNEYELVIDREEDLRGLPEDVKQRAALLANQKDKEGSWVFSLQAPSYIPFMEHADNRSLREQLFKAFSSKCFKNNERDNQAIILKTIQLKAEMAEILGYPTFAHYILEQRMAETPDKVTEFLSDLLDRSLSKAKEEVKELEDFMSAQGVSHELQRWDWSYYSEKLRRQKYELDDELIKPYFKLEYVINGVFKTAEKLFGIHFKENADIPVYQEDVIAYEVMDRKDQAIAVFLADFFPREGKRGGAWMTSYRGEKKIDGERVIPQVSIVCNFTPSTDSSPSLLKFDEVKTLFHEFGHALHGMLADTTYQSLSGTSVYWDFVELPSQIMENWCYEKECLDMFASHFESGELIPSELIDRIKASSTYHEAYATVRQLSFGMLDMAWHSLSLQEAMAIDDVATFERKVFEKTELFPKVEGTNMSVQFSHIFAGGYAAGYYSYKWAEVLDADAFSVFEQNGVFDQQTADSFKEHVLSKGGIEHPMVLYKRFRGDEPSLDPLLKRAGLIN